MPALPAGAVGVEIDVVTALDAMARQEVISFLQAAQEHDGFPSFSDQALLSLEAAPDVTAPDVTAPGVTGPGATMSPAASAVAPEAAVLLARRHGTRALVGCAVLGRRQDRWEVEIAVRPEHRRQIEDDGRRTTAGTGIRIGAVADVHGALLGAAITEAAARGGATVQAWGRDADSLLDAAMAAHGLAKTRELLQLRAPLPPGAARDAASPPVTVRPFRPGRDERAWLEVNNRAFEDHPEQSSWTMEDLERREREPWFDPQGFLLHEADGRLAAFCWTKVHRTPVLGEIYVIGVDPDFQGRGLGRAMTRAGLGHLAARGVSTAMLYVEATNTPALVLYRSLGFTEHHREALYSAALAPARHPAPPSPSPGTTDRCVDSPSP